MFGSLIPTPSRPLGLLNPLHSYIIANAQPITLANIVHVGLLPAIPLVAQAYFMYLEGESAKGGKWTKGDLRRMRIGAGVLGMGLLIRAWAGYRFTQPDLNALNVGLSLAYLHTLIKYCELAFLPQRYIDAFASRGRPMWRSVLDLCINARMIGLGVDGDVPIGSAEPVGRPAVADSRETSPGSSRQLSAEPSSSSKDANSALPIPEAGTLSVNGDVSSQPSQSPIKMGRHLPSIPKTPRTRTQAIIRHLYRGITNLWLLDALLAIQKLLGPTTLGNPHGMPGALHTFSHTHTMTILPHIPALSFTVAPWAAEMGIVAGLATGLSAGVSGVYHLFAAVALTLGWEVESWESDMMDSPLMGTSLLDVWGRRWHQLFRLILLTSTTLKLFSQPPSSPIFPPLLFIYSAVYHVIGVLSCDPVPPIIPLSGFFVISGVGGALEILFKRITGKKVRGWPGRLWVWFFLLSSGRWVVGSWIDSGLAASNLGLPGPGRWVAGWVTEYLFKAVR